MLEERRVVSARECNLTCSMCVASVGNVLHGGWIFVGHFGVVQVILRGRVYFDVQNTCRVGIHI